MEATADENSADFERLKQTLLAGAKTQIHDPNTTSRKRGLSSEDTQPVEDITDEEPFETITRSNPRPPSPPTSSLTNGFDLDPGQQFSPIRKLEFEDGDSQLPNTILTDNHGDTHHSIRLDYSPDRFGSHQYDGEETQKDPDSWNERMKDNVASVAEVSRKSENSLGSDPVPDSQSQHHEPVYFDERKRFTNVGLLARDHGDNSDDEEGVLRPTMQNNSPVMGLTQMFDASSPVRPATNTSAILTSPHIGLTSPITPRERPPTLRSSIVANNYIGTNESQALRDARDKKLSYPEDDEFCAEPAEVAARLRRQRREKDSVEQFKEISVARPAPRARQPGRRGRPPKNRIVEPLLPSAAPRSDQPLEVEVIAEEQDSASEEESISDEPELEVPGTMEPAVTEVKKTQSSQYRSDKLRSSNAQDLPNSSDMEAVADSQPQTTAKVARKLRSAGTADDDSHTPALISSSFLNPKQNKRKNDERDGHLSRGKSSTQEMPPSSPPVRESSDPERDILAESMDAPQFTSAREQGASDIFNYKDNMKTPLTIKKIPLPLPTTIPATSPYNRDNLLLNAETPVPVRKRKRPTGEPELPSMVPKLSATNPSVNHDPSDVQPLQSTGEELPKPKRLRSNNFPRDTELVETSQISETRDRFVRPRTSTGEAEPIYVGEPGSPMNLSMRNSSTEPDSTADFLGKPETIAITTTPQRTTIPFRPSASQRQELSGSGPLRVFAEWERAYYPAVIHEIPKFNESTPARFVGGESFVRLDRMKTLEFDVGDNVKVKGQRQKVYIVQEAYKGTVTSGGQMKTESQLERETVLDVHGNNMAKLKHKASGEVIEVPIGDIYLTGAQFNSLKTKTLELEYSLRSDENTPLFKKEDSILVTPSKLRRNTPNVSFGTQKVMPLKVPAISSKGRQGIFHGMQFTISLTGESTTDRAILSSMLQRDGGQILNDGFDDIFLAIQSETAELQPRPGWSEIGFTAVISDRASTTSKYLQALALGIPCLSPKWVEDSVQCKTALSWHNYLLPAGESQYLDGATKSRVINWIDIQTATFTNMYSSRAKLMEGMNVIIHSSNKSKNEPQVYPFLIHAMGPSQVKYAASVEEVNKILKSKNPVTRWHYILSKDEKPKFNLKGRARDPASTVRVVNNEWVKQSLIFGKLLDEAY
ncbi:hypothetical protein ABW21_db0205911 [Orbilia brochopaga]|nr:hypothetical protein ABW21_db0205911 [Drechslerella brochopaga]